MNTIRLVERPAFDLIGQQVWISGPDNDQFGRFWEQCRTNGLLDQLNQIKQQAGQPAGAQTGGAILGVSRVDQDPANRSFYYQIAIETPQAAARTAQEGLERYHVPAAHWAIFECRGPLPDAIVAAEIYAFTQWLPQSGFRHALAPEMEVYPPTDEAYCEFWLPVEDANR